MPVQPTKTVLVVDDDPEIRIALTHYLGSEGFSVEIAANGREMSAILNSHLIDLVLLDLGLQNESGLDLLKNMVANTGIAVVILTGKSDPIERVVGLELGADDYIVKPFLKRELLARINAVLRRTSSQHAAPQTEHFEKSRQIRMNNWVMDLQMRQVQSLDGTPIDLTGIEFDLLSALASNVGYVLAAEVK